MVLTSSRKGAIAESRIAAAAIEAGLGVLRPLVEGGRYDLVFDDGTRLLRVQCKCKWASLRAGVVAIRLRTSRHTPGGYVRTTYSSSEVDAVAAYCRELDRCYLVPIELVANLTDVNLRLSKPKNNQIAGIRWARDFELGAIAQLGERRHGMAEVAGSIPASSIACEAVRKGGLTSF